MPWNKQTCSQILGLVSSKVRFPHITKCSSNLIHTYVCNYRVCLTNCWKQKNPCMSCSMYTCSQNMEQDMQAIFLHPQFVKLTPYNAPNTIAHTCADMCDFASIVHFSAPIDNSKFMDTKHRTWILINEALNHIRRLFLL